MTHLTVLFSQGMEVYSTVLWHLKREVQLAALAQQVVGLDRLSPHAWCVMGNCFSLHKVRRMSQRLGSPPVL